jgi:hypothetical protein
LLQLSLLDIERRQIGNRESGRHECAVQARAPQVIPSREPERLAHEDKAKYVRPYVPDDAWGPIYVFPATHAFDWCGEFSLFSEDEYWAREHGPKAKAAT